MNGNVENGKAGSKREQYVHQSLIKHHISMKQQEKWLKIPVDTSSSSFTDFRGLMNKQRELLSDNADDINALNDGTLMSKFKQLIGPKASASSSSSSSASMSSMPRATSTAALDALMEDEKRDGDASAVAAAAVLSDLDHDAIGNSGAAGAAKFENNKPNQDYIRRFWMSDANCGQCSECGATFHTFRRKHHCRLCGRIFCQTCCSERVSVNQFKKLKLHYNNLRELAADEDNTVDLAIHSDDNADNSNNMVRVCIFCVKVVKPDEELLGIAMRYPNSVVCEDDRDKQDNNDNNLHGVYDTHFKYVIAQLCKFESLSEDWAALLYDFSVRANRVVCPDLYWNDFNDIRHYVKVKRIAGGNIADSTFVRGVIVRKNVAHRKMRTDILHPKILLLDQAIEYHRMHSPFHSFDILLRQNEEYMRMIVNKIVELGPDIVVVANQCSRLALKEMVRENITLVADVDTSTMERIARAIEAPVIHSIDHLHQLDEHAVLGRCGRFYLHYFNNDPVGTKGRRTPLMFFDECRGNHATILLRGDKKPLLCKVKNVIRIAMHTLYHIELEKSVLQNLKTSVSVNAAESDVSEFYQKLQAENQKHLFLSTSPFISHCGWKREHCVSKLKRLEVANIDDRFPHLQLYPYNHHALGFFNNVQERWDPFLPNTDNLYVCQSLVVNHCRVAMLSQQQPQQCFPPQLKLIDFYTHLDCSLGEYLLALFECNPCPTARCKEPLSAHLLTYSHAEKTVYFQLHRHANHALTVDHLNIGNGGSSSNSHHDFHGVHSPRNNSVGGVERQIFMYTRCRKCDMYSRAKPMLDRSFFCSFGKFLEMEFYSHPATPFKSACKHNVFDDHVKCFSLSMPNTAEHTMHVEMYGKHKVPFTVFTSKDIATNWRLQFKYYVNEMNILELVSKYAFAAFFDKLDELIPLIGNYDIITKDLHKLRQEVNDECQKIAKQFIDHRDHLQQNFQPQLSEYKFGAVGSGSGSGSKSTNIHNPGTIAFLNRIRYRLYRLSCEWNEVLDGLRILIAPSDAADGDNTNRWMKKFKAPFKGLRSSSSKEKERKEAAANKSKLADSNNNGLASPAASATNQSDEEMSDKAFEAGLHEVESVHFDVLRRSASLGKQAAQELQPQQTNETSLEQIVNVISPRVRDVSFVVDLSTMFQEHKKQQKLVKKISTLSVKIASPAEDDESKHSNHELSVPSNHSNASTPKSPSPNPRGHVIPSAATIFPTSMTHAASMPAVEVQDAIDKNNNNNTEHAPLSLAPVSPTDLSRSRSNPESAKSASSIASRLFPTADTDKMNIPATLRQAHLTDIDIGRLRQESLFLVAACTQHANDIGGHPSYAHLNLPKCLNNNVIPIFIEEPSAIISYTLSSLEYHCVMNQIPTERVRACRHNGRPSVQELEQQVYAAQLKRRQHLESELEIRDTVADNGSGNSAIDDELDLDDLLHHITKLKHVSKMEYLDAQKKYNEQAKKQGKPSTESGALGGSSDDRRNDGSQAYKFQFIDAGYFVPDQSVDNLNINTPSTTAAASMMMTSLLSTATPTSPLAAENGAFNSAFDDKESKDDATHFTHPIPNPNSLFSASSGSLMDMSTAPPNMTSTTHTVKDRSGYVSTTFSCHVYYPYQFRALRRRLYGGEEDYIESLSRCQVWNALGGKSGSTFKKTSDHRFVLKFVKHNEFNMFVDNARSYFEHEASVLFKNYPSVLVHIVGAYQISWTKSNKSQFKKKYVIVMPNLWYSKNITKQFDLKGSTRGRYVEDEDGSKMDEEKDASSGSGNANAKVRFDANGDDNNSSSSNNKKPKAVMLDKNFIEYMRGFPMTLEDSSKQHLHKAVHNDTLFLCRSDVIDYSLLVGINDNELVVGIIDYLRIYTWDKAVEEQAKSIGMVIGRSAPTIVRPKNYKQRFREAMERYFMLAPDRKTKRINRPKDKTLRQAFEDIFVRYNC